MRIAIVCPYDWSAHGGVRAHVEALAGQLRTEHEVHIVAPMSGPLSEGPVNDRVVSVGRTTPIPFNRSIARVAATPGAARRTLRVLADLAPDITHVHEPGVPMISLAAASRAAPPLVGTFHAWSDRDRIYGSSGPFGRRIAQRLGARIAVSPAAQRYHASALHLPLGDFRVVPNGVDAQRFASAEPLPELVDAERPVLLFVGRLEPRKGLEVFIRAFIRLRAERPELRLVVLGDGSERERCEAMLPVRARPDVLFVGAVDEADKPRFHASADVFVAPNLGGESFGIVLLEAMAAGLPVVASDIPGFRTVMRDGREGRLVAPGDGFALADAIAELLDHPRRAEAMARAGAQAAERHAWPRVTERIVEVYTEVAARA